MFRHLYKISAVLLVLLALASCANRGTPSGGEKDITPPRILKSVPENGSTNFTAREIKIYFDEYVKVKDLQKQLIISPPMDPAPDIMPMGLASKFISIKINDTLSENTTYVFNFGQSIVDNNEGNPFPYYKYILSTGDYIDSLSVKGTIIDAEKLKPDNFVSVMLYEMDETYTDSIVYKKKPKYITNTLDSTTTFSIDNIKAGRYKLIALKDVNDNFTFQPKTDRIGFYADEIIVPSDELYELKLFKEQLNFKAFRPKQEAGQKIAFGYEGDAKDIKIDVQTAVGKDYEYRLTKDKTKDTLYYWYKPKVALDSTYFLVQNKTYKDTLFHRFRDLKRDTLVIKPVQTGAIAYDELYAIEGSVPFVRMDKSLIRIMNKDSLTLDFTAVLDTLTNRYLFDFKKEEGDTYKIQLLPNALTDFFGQTNDTLNYGVRSRLFSDLSDIRVTLRNAEYPVIVQLTDSKGVVKYEQFADKPKAFDFVHIQPGSYNLRVVYDTNNNMQWDPGSFLEQRQPERISYFPELLDARAGWDLVQEFILE